MTSHAIRSVICLRQVWITVALRSASNAAVVGGVDNLGVQSCLTLGVTLLEEVPCCPPSLPTLTLLPGMPIGLSQSPGQAAKGIHDN